MPQIFLKYIGNPNVSKQTFIARDHTRYFVYTSEWFAIYEDWKKSWQRSDVNAPDLKKNDCLLLTYDKKFKCPQHVDGLNGVQVLGNYGSKK